MIDGNDAFIALDGNPDWNYYTSTDSNGDSHVELKGKTSNNTIVFKNIKQDYALPVGVAAVKLSNNTLIIDNSTITANWIEGGYSYNGNANDNTVVINNSTIIAHVYGGDAHHKDAIGNTIIIAGDSDINGNIYGGYSMVPEKEDVGKWSGRADNNTIIVKKNTNKEALADSRIYGGYVSITKAMEEHIDKNGGVSEKDFTKKIIPYFGGWSGSILAVRSTDNVNFYNMKLSDFVSNDPNTAKPILTITGDRVADSFTNIVGTDNTLDLGSKDINIGLSFQGGQDINAGETIRLVQMNENGSAVVDTGAVVNGKKIDKIKLANDGTAYAGVAQVLKGKLDVQEEYIDYTIKSVSLNDQVNVVNEGRAASAAFLNQSDELISEALQLKPLKINTALKLCHVYGKVACFGFVVAAYADQPLHH